MKATDSIRYKHHRPGSRRRHALEIYRRGFKWLSGLGIYSQLGMVALVTAVTVMLAFPRPVTYDVGDVAEYTIRADRALRIVDHLTTTRQMDEAEATVPPVYVLDDTLTVNLEQRAADIFSAGRELVAAAADMPESAGRLKELEGEFSRLFNIPVGSTVWRRLVAVHFKPAIERQVISLSSEVMALGILGTGGALDEGQRHRPVSVILSSSRLEYALPTAASLLDSRSAGRLLEVRTRALSARFSQEEIDLILSLTRGLMRPNINPDLMETERRVAAARSDISSAYINIRAGEVIVREGSVIGVEAMEKIKALKAAADSHDWFYKSLGLFVALFTFFNSGLILSLIDPRQAGFRAMSVREQVFISLLLLLAALMAHSAGLFGSTLSWNYDFLDSHTLFYAMPLSAVTMLMAIFFGIRKASFMALFAAMVATIVTPGGNFTVFVYSFNGSIAGTWCLLNMNERWHLIPASFWVMAVNCLTLLGLTLYADVQWSRQTIYNFCAAAASGALSGIVASGMIPLIESAFGFNTNLKLLELGNLDRPILRDLMLSAPGTYHHSVIVGAMVEAAAEAIGANPHLARVGAYYHDIGKMKKPLYFVENQTGENRHDSLSPSMSALILIGHVKDGVDLAHAYHLPQDIVDIVEQHHGTSLMAFFYHKAKEQRQEGQPEVNEGDFRYPGPRPRTKEAGLVMLADICEAATRSLSEPTPLKIRNMVRHLVNSVFSDGQLDDCELTGREIAEVINNFTTILIGIYHHRVAYPGSRKDGPKEAPKETADKKPEAGREAKEIYGRNLSLEPAKRLTH